MYQDVRHPSNGRLLFRYDPARQIIEVGKRGETVIIDLTRYRAAPSGEQVRKLETKTG